MTSKNKHMPKIAARSIAGGMILMSFFTFMWAGIAVSGLSLAFTVLVLGIFIPISIFVMLHGIYFFVRSRHFPSLSTAADKAQGTRMGIAYGIIFGTEAAVIAVVANVLSALHLDDFVIASIALIVGLHLYPMAKVFSRTLDYYVATWICSVALFGMWLIVTRAVPHQTVLAIIGISTAAATSVYGLYMWNIKRRALRP